MKIIPKILILFLALLMVIITTNHTISAGNALTFLSVNGDKIFNQQSNEVKLRGAHYFNSFYVMGAKSTYDLVKSNGGDPDQLNVVLSPYFLSDSDIQEFKSLGANAVRVDMKLWQIENAPYAYSQTSLNHLDQVIKRFGDSGIYVILDLHAAGQNGLNHNVEYGNILWSDSNLQDRVVSLWSMLADRYKDNPYVAGYDIINEPEAPDKNTLHNFYQAVIDKIRITDKNHILILEENLYNRDIISFGGVYSDPNIVLSRHFYLPHAFTYQGMNNNPTGQIYPGTYSNVYWNKSQIDSEFDKLLAGNESKGKPIFIGEFSANAWYGGQYALNWNRDVMDSMNSRNIHWTFFSYKSTNPKNFGFYSQTQATADAIQARLQQGNYGALTEAEKSLFSTTPANYESPAGIRELLQEKLKDTTPPSAPTGLAVN